MAETFVFRGSSNLSSASYDPDTQELTIEFTNGDEYSYSGVPPETYRSLTLASSAGQFFHRAIKNSYAYEQM